MRFSIGMSSSGTCATHPTLNQVPIEKDTR